MKVGVVVDNEYHSDVRVKREVRLLKSFGHELYVLCLTHKKKYTYAEEGVYIFPVFLKQKIKNTLYFFMNMVPFYEWWWTRQVRSFVKMNAIEVVHTHDLYMSKCVGRGIKKSGRKVPMILDLHENYPHAIQSYKWSQGFIRSILVNPKRWVKKEKKYLTYPDRLLVLSEDFKKLLLDRYMFLAEEKILVFPNVVDTEEFDRYPIKEEKDLSLPPGPRVLYFGMVASRRGIFRSLDVFEALLKKSFEASLVIVGPVDQGDKGDFFARIGQEVFRERVMYIPWIELSELPSYLMACDIALAPFDKNPQHESGIANKIFQYMYGKLPIVASNCKPQEELINDYGIGEIFSSDEEFLEKLSLLLADKERREHMGEKAYHTLMKEFHQDAFSEKLNEFYQKAVD